MKLQPLFKWTGGKNRMREVYNGKFFPNRAFTRFVDAFYGAGAITHWVLDEYPDTEEFVINDFNAEVVDMYEQLRDNTNEFVERTIELEAKYLEIDGVESRKAFYNKLKMMHINDYKTQGKLVTAVNLHFMLKTNFNGWWKIYNYSNGRYATPPGVMNQKKRFININNLRNTGNFFRNRCVILCGDFQNTTQSYVDDKTFIYFDPPYRDSTTKYTEGDFLEEDQIRLCKYFDWCVSDKGALAALSNKEIGDGFFETHLGNYCLHKMEAKYTAGRGTTLNKVYEILVTSYDNQNNGILDLL